MSAAALLTFRKATTPRRVHAAAAQSPCALSASAVTGPSSTPISQLVRMCTCVPQVWEVWQVSGVREGRLGGSAPADDEGSEGLVWMSTTIRAPDWVATST